MIMSKRYCNIIAIFLIIVQQVCCYQDLLLSELCTTNPLKKAFNKLMDNKPVIRLTESDNSAALIHQTWNSSSFKRFDECSFSVDAARDGKNWRTTGLYLSIKHLNLRSNPYDGECIDYIRFKFNDKKTAKICSPINTQDIEKFHYDVYGGLTKVYISIDKLRPLQKIEDTLDIELVFTAYESCSEAYSVRCTTSNTDSCISSRFQDDGIVNCPPPLFRDEKGIQLLFNTTQSHPNGDTTNNSDIILSAITSLIFTLVGVGSCFWICWKIKDCLVGEVATSATIQNTDRDDRSNSANTALNEGAVSLNLAATGPSDRDQSAYYRPSAPPLDEKHDSPPSYDALYPERNSK